MTQPLDEAVPAWRRLRPAAAAEWSAVALVVLFYAAFKTYAMWLRPGDEHIYFAMARAVAEGAIPYRDFFFAHPPVHLLVPALVFKLFGFSYPVAFWIAPTACLLAGLALWRLLRRFAPPWAAVAALVFFLFGRTVVQSSAHMTGVNIAMAFLLWGAERLAAGRPRQGGSLLALSVLTGLYTLPAALGILVCLGILRPAALRRAAVMFLLVGLGTFVSLDLVSGGALFEQVVWYQRAKGPEMGGGWPTFDSTKGAELFHNWGLFLGAIVGGLAGFVAMAAASVTLAPVRAEGGARVKRGAKARRAPASDEGPGRGAGFLGALGAALADRRRPDATDAAAADGAAGPGFRAWLGAIRRRIVDLCAAAPWATLAVVGALWVAFHWAFLATLAVVWRYYYAVVFIGASVASAMALVALWRGLRPLPALVRARAARASAWSPVAYGSFVALATALFWGHDLELGRKHDIWGEERVDPGKAAACAEESCARRCTNDGYVAGSCDERKGCVCRYGWADSPAGWVPARFNAAVRRLWWGGDTIPDGRGYSSIENTLWHESRGAPLEPRFLDAADAIVERACPGDTVFGDSGTAPMLANLTGLGVAGLVFDTNQQRFATGYIDPAETVRRIRADGARFVALRSGGRDTSGRETFGNSWAQSGPIAGFLREFDRIWPRTGEPEFDIVVLDRKGARSCGP